MAFGRATRYWQLDVEKVSGSNNKRETWDRAVKEASDEYKKRMVALSHNIQKCLNSFKWLNSNERSITCSVTTVIRM